MIAACLVLPQGLVALLSPWVGRVAESWGRRPILLLGFAALPVRGLLFALVKQPLLIVVVQALGWGERGGIRGAAAAGGGRHHPGQRAVQSLHGGDRAGRLGRGATLSTGMAGVIADHYHRPAAFLALGATGGVAFLLLLALQSETKPLILRQ